MMLGESRIEGRLLNPLSIPIQIDPGEEYAGSGWVEMLSVLWKGPVGCRKECGY